MAKKQISSDEKIEDITFPLFPALEALDKKNYHYFDTLTEEQRKGFAAFIIIKWMSCVKASSPIQQFYVLSTNEFANKYLLDTNINAHPKLQWMMLCAAGLGAKQFHQYLPQLSELVTSLRDKAKPADVEKFFSKSFNVDGKQLKELSEAYVDLQHKKHYLAKLNPSMKIDDIEVLAQFVTQKDIEQYEQDIGNQA